MAVLGMSPPLKLGSGDSLTQDQSLSKLYCQQDGLEIYEYGRQVTCEVQLHHWGICNFTRVPVL